MPLRRLSVLELAPAADELWELDHDSARGYLYRQPGAVALPDVARGAKLRPCVSAAYASGKATNIARVFDAFLREDARCHLARRAKQALSARLLTYLPGQPVPYRQPQVPGPRLAPFTPGAAYLACLQARDFHAVTLDLEALPATACAQTDRRCANIVASDGGELVNFSPYLLWEPVCVDAVLDSVGQQPPADVLGLAGSLPLVNGKPAPGIYAGVIAQHRQAQPDSFISLDVSGPPIEACLSGGAETSPDAFCINMDEYASISQERWKTYAGTVVIHTKRGCWLVRDEAPHPLDLHRRGPDIPVPEKVNVIHTICAGDAAHGGLLLGLMLHGTGADGWLKAAALSQACALTVVESHDSIRGLTAEKVEANLARFPSR